MTYELTQVEAAYRAVARCEGRVICFHPTLAELPALFGMTNQGFNAGSAIRKASASLRLALRQTPDIFIFSEHLQNLSGILSENGRMPD